VCSKLVAAVKEVDLLSSPFIWKIRLASVGKFTVVHVFILVPSRM